MVKKTDQNKDKAIQTSLSSDTPSTSTKTPEATVSNKVSNQNQQIKSIEKVMSEKAETNLPKLQTPFSFEREVSEIKSTIPLTELITVDRYRSQIFKVFDLESKADTLNLTDDKPELLFGPKVEGEYQEGSISPFYISLNIRDKILHNAMLDSGASHNLMPKAVMENLGLEVTQPYKNLYSFDSSQVKCVGLIKNLDFALTQLPAKNLVMDVVVADITPKYGMLLSRAWSAKIQGSLQMDMSFATIPVFNQTRRLYREARMKYMVSNRDKPNNTPIYSIHSNLDSFILYNEGDIHKQIKENKDTSKPLLSEEIDDQSPKEPKKQLSIMYKEETLWSINFDGSCGKTGSGAGIWIHNTKEGHSFRLEFQCTNNIAEYEALLIGLHMLRDLGANRITAQGDSELVIKQIKGEYLAKNPRLREYRNAALDILKTFEKYELIYIPRIQNSLANELAFAASTSQIPCISEQYDIQVKHRPTIPDNLDHWQVFQDDDQIDDFLQSRNEFEITKTDSRDEERKPSLSQDQELNLPLWTNLNLVEHSCDREIEEDIDQRELEVLHCENDTIPRGLAPLEELFDFNDVAKKPKMESTEDDIEEYNIGNLEEPKNIKLSKTLPPNIKHRYINLFKEFKDVFAWGYQDLKSYDTSIIQHKIPLKENQKPFKQKLRRINPVLLPLVEKEIKKMYDARIIVSL